MPTPITLPARRSLPSAIYGDDEPVLAGVTVREDVDRAQLPRLGDDHWDLGAIIFRVNARYSNYRLNFARIADPVTRRLAKEYVIARLRIHVPGYRAPCGATSAIRLLRYIQHFAAFLSTRIGAVDLSRIDQALLDAYLVHARDGGRRTPNETVKYVEVPIDLHHLSPWLTGGGIGILPWRGRAAHHVAGRPPAPAENATPRIPAQIIGAMLRWSLKYIEVYAPDILAARAELDALEARCARLIARDVRTGRPVAKTYRARVAKWLDARRAAGRGVPIWERAPNAARQIDPLNGREIPPYNLHLMRLHVGAPESGRVSQSKPTEKLINEAAFELGTEIGGLDTPISIDPDTGLPWRERFDGLSLAREERMLQGACYVVCAYLTGMRDSEVQAMQPGCVSAVRSADGLVERYRLRSTVYKRQGARGAKADWITIEPVARAVAVMEVLSERNRREKGLSSLWVALKDWPWSNDHLGMGATITLNLFRDGLDARSADTPAIPRIGGEPWKFTTRQLRRTVAWYIANRPFGTVAGRSSTSTPRSLCSRAMRARRRPTSASPSNANAPLASSTTSLLITKRSFVTKVRRDLVPRGCDASSRVCRTSLAISRAASWIASGCAPCSPISAGPYMWASSMIAFSTPQQRSALETHPMPNEWRPPCHDAAPIAARTPV